MVVGVEAHGSFGGISPLFGTFWAWRRVLHSETKSLCSSGMSVSCAWYLNATARSVLGLVAALAIDLIALWEASSIEKESLVGVNGLYLLIVENLLLLEEIKRLRASRVLSRAMTSQVSLLMYLRLSIPLVSMSARRRVFLRVLGGTLAKPLM